MATTTIMRRDPRVDEYIANAAPFARPILAHLRSVVHAACPDVVEDLKWRMPFFTYAGTNLCHMAAFKGHCAFGFWRGKEIAGLPTIDGNASMGSVGRLGSLDDLPPRRQLTSWIKAAMKLNDAATRPARATSKRAALAVPDDLATALRARPDAAERFEALAPSARRDYCEWVLEAKRESTRASRIATTVDWVAEGRTRHWKYRR